MDCCCWPEPCLAGMLSGLSACRCHGQAEPHMMMQPWALLPMTTGFAQQKYLLVQEAGDATQSSWPAD